MEAAAGHWRDCPHALAHRRPGSGSRFGPGSSKATSTARVLDLRARRGRAARPQPARRRSPVPTLELARFEQGDEHQRDEHDDTDDDGIELREPRPSATRIRKRSRPPGEGRPTALRTTPASGAIPAKPTPRYLLDLADLGRFRGLRLRLDGGGARRATPESAALSPDGQLEQADEQPGDAHDNDDRRRAELGEAGDRERDQKRHLERKPGPSPCTM